jgi:hypothetical protein
MNEAARFAAEAKNFILKKSIIDEDISKLS